MPQLLGELVDDAFDLGELGGFEVFVARFDCRSHAALDMRVTLLPNTSPHLPTGTLVVTIVDRLSA